MAASRSALWPEPTPAPFAIQDSRSPKRRRLQARQTIADQDKVATAMTQCQFDSGNEIISCFPTAETFIPQGDWASFVWNARRPDLLQTNLVNIYLFRADSQQQLLSFKDVVNPFGQAGVIRAQVNDTWFGEGGKDWSGKDINYPFYWLITRNDKPVDGTAVAQPIFTAVQTTALDSVARSSSSAAAAASSSASVMSASAASFSSVLSASSASVVASAKVQNDASHSSFPHWAIAVIVVLGFLAITATCLLTFLICRRVRRRQRSQQTSRNSMGSNSPMINRDGEMSQRYDTPGSPLLPPPSTAALASGGVAAGGPWHGHGSLHDGASTDSGGPFSGADAAIMAQAFRTTLKQPNFVDRPVEEGESPEQPEGEEAEGGHTEGIGNSTLSRELAAEGRDIRSVSSSRGVKVETTPGESGGTNER
ncbi:hypothetical protein CPB83DRAFT_647202 [Crepidotus variabilis]|uniref:Uncharacterized protein n=1 Tax=Crepidotus variabilis TaxID=179855 RepID=A0A9P6E7Q2_9AGAR|nr:hypothetical protein CPB83DRAFT_647202 [Crepidotus variabilis]